MVFSNLLHFLELELVLFYIHKRKTGATTPAWIAFKLFYTAGGEAPALCQALRPRR